LGVASLKRVIVALAFSGARGLKRITIVGYIIKIN